MASFVKNISSQLEKLKDLPPLFFRLILAYGFFWPFMHKVQGFEGTVQWFTSMGFFMPWLSVILAIAAEGLGVILLTLGLGTRLICIPLMFVMGVAIYAVHLPHGFGAGDNGFEIPLYYFLMLFSLLVTGAGRWSLDHLWCGKK